MIEFEPIPGTKPVRKRKASAANAKAKGKASRARGKAFGKKPARRLTKP